MLAIGIIAGLTLGWFSAALLLYCYGDRLLWWWANTRVGWWWWKRGRVAAEGVSDGVSTKLVESVPEARVHEAGHGRGVQ